MPTVLNLNIKEYSYDKSSKTFYMSERDVNFDTTYELFNPKTGNKKTFKFTESTGNEFDPKTRWIYKSDDGIRLEVCNDPEVTKRRGEHYLRAKTNNY